MKKYINKNNAFHIFKLYLGCFVNFFVNIIDTAHTQNNWDTLKPVFIKYKRLFFGQKKQKTSSNVKLTTEAKVTYNREILKETIKQQC